MSIIKSSCTIFTLVLGSCGGSKAEQAHFGIRDEFRRLRRLQVVITEYGRVIHLNLNYVRGYNNSRSSCIELEQRHRASRISTRLFVWTQIMPMRTISRARLISLESGTEAMDDMEKAVEISPYHN